jgi:hypothetical protein
MKGKTTMTKRISSAALLLFAALAPMEGRPALIDVSEVELTALGSFRTQGQPEKTAFDSKSAPLANANKVEVLVLAEGVLAVPFPNIPTSQTVPFASSAGENDGHFGVGVNGFFFRNSLPPNVLSASGTWTQTITNNLTGSLSLFADVNIPKPTIQFFGVGNSFPLGVDPDRDVTATFVNARFVTKVTHPDGSIVEEIPLDYGIRLVRVPIVGQPLAVLLPVPSRDAVGLSRFDEPDGSFGFQLPVFADDNFHVGDIGPGDTFEFSFEYFASASTGFGETGIFAAIGDPFDLSAGGGRFELQIGDAVGPGPTPGIPAPSTVALLGLGLFLLRSSARDGRRTSRPLANGC